MLSFEQWNIIKEQSKKENADEFVEQFIMYYATDVNRIGKLLSLIPKVANKQLKINQERIQEYAWATDLLLVERSIYPIEKRKFKKKDNKSDFATLLYVCKAHFPSGNCEGGSQGDKEFFTEFIDAVRDKIGFDYKNKDDWRWICNTANCREWMIEVIKQHIDSNFIEPEVEINWRLKGKR